MKRTDYTPEIIAKKVRQRLIWKIAALIVLEIAGILFMQLYGAAYFGKLSEVNVYVAYGVLAVAPILVCGILYDLIDRGWRGEIRKIRTSVVKKWSADDSPEFNSSNSSVGRNNRYNVSVNIRTEGGNAEDHSLGIILDGDLDRMGEGDTLVHYRGTHLFHVIPQDKTRPEHFIGRL